ncbi:MAG: DUF308 domain-containing protein [Lachnospira sp.]|nr:DUF308 domain-containing protein [Lachnospira sp.]
MNKNTIKTITLVTGIITVLLGIYAVVTPLRTFLAIGWILGILFLMNGVELVIAALSKEKKEVGTCIIGVIEGIVGLMLLFSGVQRFLTDVAATYLVGGSLLIYGIFQIVKGVKKCQESKSKGILGIICGALGVLAGILAFTHPIITMISVGYMIAFSILMQGINMTVLAINLGKEDGE